MAMRRWAKRTAVGAVGVPVALAVVACAGGKSLEEAAKGTWDCTISQGSLAFSGTVTVGDGTYQVSQGGGEGSSGTWTLSGGKLEVKGDDGPYQVNGVPGEVDELMGMEFGEDGSEELSPWSIGWKGDTVTFPYHGAKVACQKM
ncbi:hypothetical protein ACFC0D_34250 [Streptomyces sp. NPDC056222]|uniref:hypothetical protein n=1 Tax=Streptomyces sp. NPDC056222 TaxID=3345749 RepID=UPI0035E15A1B